MQINPWVYSIKIGFLKNIITTRIINMYYAGDDMTIAGMKTNFLGSLNFVCFWCMAVSLTIIPQLPFLYIKQNTRQRVFVMKI